MNSYKIVLLSIAFAFIFSSIAFAGVTAALTQDHSLRIGLQDTASEKGVRDNYSDLAFFQDHSFRHGVQSPESDNGVRGYFPETDMLQDSGITDDGGRLPQLDGPTD